MGTVTADGAVVTPLVDERLLELRIPLRLEAPLSMFPAGASGYSTVNAYVLVEDSEILLVDTGFPAQRDIVLGLLGELLEPGREIAVMALRPGEPNSYGNLVPVAGAYRVTKYYSMLPHQLMWAFDVGMESAGALERAAAAGSVSDLLPMRGASRTLTLGQGRQLEWFRPLLHMILQTWLYDAGTKTLFTSEVFSHATRSTIDGPWVVRDPDENPVAPAELAEFLGSTDRFWWLPGADTKRLADWLEDAFARFDVERIAPSFGCVIEGSAAVARALETLVAALALLGERENSYATAVSA